MSSTINNAILVISGSPVLSILAKVTITMALVLICTRLMRRSRASVRHVILAAGFAVLIILPIASIVIPAVHITVPVQVRHNGASAAAVDPTSNVSEITTAEGNVDVTPVTAKWWTRVSLSAFLITLWIGGFVAFLLPVIIGLWEMRSVRRVAFPWQEIQPLVNILATEKGIRRSVQVRVDEIVPGPMTCGIVKPTIMLPLDAQTWPEENLNRAIIHELEHVWRWDWLTRSIARAICAFYWFHPLVWIAWRQFALDAERACDDAVVEHADATAYADQLVVLAQNLFTSNQSGLGMANRRDLASRVTSLLDMRQRRGRAGRLCLVMICIVSAALVSIIAPVRIATAEQTTRSNVRPVDTPKWDVISVKPCKDISRAGRASPRFSPGRMDLPCLTVAFLIQSAYDLFANGRGFKGAVGPSSRTVPISDGPAWMHSELYQISAKAQGTPSSGMMQGPMLQILLEDRFKLKIDNQIKEGPVYVLTVASRGRSAKLQPVNEGACVEPGSDDFKKLPPMVRGKWPPPFCGATRTQRNGPNITLDLYGMSMTEISDNLTWNFLDLPVIDQTGLTGMFDFRVEFAPDENMPGFVRSDEPASAPSIFTAMQEQLGLRLVKGTGPVPRFVIDHIERPSENDAIVDLRNAVDTSNARAAAGPLQIASAIPIVSQTAQQTKTGGGRREIGLLPQTTAEQRPSFEVASIKVNNDPAGPTSIVCHGTDSGMPSNASPALGRCLVRRFTLNMLISIAYGPETVRLSGLPAWANGDRFDIEAKAENPATATRDQLRLMTQSLLADRFGLVFHRGTDETAGYVLVVAKDGPKLKETADVSDRSGLFGPPNRGPLRGTHTEMSKLAQVLSTGLGQPVVDKTGLNGNYDFVLSWTPDVASGENAEPRPVDPNAPSLFTAVEEQLGLRLVSQKVPVEVLIIDRVQKPAPN